jgi:hypothetical protein
LAISGELVFEAQLIPETNRMDMQIMVINLLNVLTIPISFQISKVYRISL